MSSRIDDIDILRGFAVLVVVMHHALGNLFTWTTPQMSRVYVHFSGDFGVDLFFAISGFVIARILVPQLQASSGWHAAYRITVAFWIRRAWRLLPSAWTWLALILLAVVLFNQSGVFGTFQANLEATIAGVLQVANLRFAATFMQSEYGASFVYWSLSLEEQFYLVLPLLVLISRRLFPYVLIVLVIIQLVSTRTLLMVVFRTDAIALGVLLAIWSGHGTYAIVRPVILVRLRWVGLLLMLSLLSCIGVAGSEFVNAGSFRFSLYALLSALLVWLASYDMDLFNPLGPLKRLLLWVGSRSYAIYLIHIPAFFLTREIWFRLHPSIVPGDEFFFQYLLTASVLIILLSELNCRLIETPFRLHGSAIAKRFLAAEPKIAAQPELSYNKTRASDD